MYKTKIICKCGGTAWIREQQNRTTKNNYYRLQCDKCLASTSGYLSEETAIKSWFEREKRYDER